MSRKFWRNFQTVRRAWVVPAACLLGLVLASIPQASSASQGGSSSAVALRSPVGNPHAVSLEGANGLTTPAAKDGGLALVRASLVADDVYYLKTFSGKCMTVRGASQAQGATVDQYTCLSQANQKWILNYVDDIWMTFRNVNSAQCLAVNGGTNTNGARLIQWPCTGQNYMKFQYAGSGAIFTRSSNLTKCVVVNGYSTANSAILIQYTCNRASNQNWTKFG